MLVENRKNIMKKQAFTLIELLVVIAIIALLIRHGRGVNALYLDWHVGHVLTEDMVKSANGVEGGAGLDIFRFWK